MKNIIMFLVVVSSLFGGQLGVDNGRFVFGQINDARADQFLLDTATGQMWRMVLKEKDETILIPIMIRSKLYDNASKGLVNIDDYMPVQVYQQDKKNK